MSECWSQGFRLGVFANSHWNDSASPRVPYPMEDTMELKRSGTRVKQQGPAEWFTGEVTIEPLSNPPEPSRIGCASVTFQPGARTAWHTHPLGQTLIVTTGAGWSQCEGDGRVEIREGDVVWCPPNHKHWHGATPTTAMPVCCASTIRVPSRSIG